MSREKNPFPEPRLKKQRSGIWWIEWTEDSKNRRESTTTKDEREARILLNRKSLELLTPKPVSERLTVNQVCDAYIASKALDNADTSSMKYSLAGIRHFLGDAFYDTLTDDVMKAFVRWRKTQAPKGPQHIIDARTAKNTPLVANGTIKREIGGLRAALKLCARQKLIDPVPSPLCPVSVSDQRHRYLTKEEYVRLLEASKQAPHINLYLQIALLTGQRRKAILELQWSDVAFNFDQLTYDLIAANHGITEEQEQAANENEVEANATTRLNLSRSVIITFGDGIGNKRKAPPIEVRDEMLIRSLYAAYKRADSDYVIEWVGKPIKNVSTALRRTCERAGIEKISTHVMRHTTISWLISAGVSSTAVAKRVNVSQEIIDKHYAHMSPEIQRRQEEILSVGGVATMANVS